MPACKVVATNAEMTPTLAECVVNGSLIVAYMHGRDVLVLKYSSHKVWGFRHLAREPKQSAMYCRETAGEAIQAASKAFSVVAFDSMASFTNWVMGDTTAIYFKPVMERTEPDTVTLAEASQLRDNGGAIFAYKGQRHGELRVLTYSLQSAGTPYAFSSLLKCHAGTYRTQSLRDSLRSAMENETVYCFTNQKDFTAWLTT